MNKKNRFLSAMLAPIVGGAFWIPSAHAGLIPYQLDTYLGKANLSNSGDATELAALQGLVGANIILVQDDKIKINKGGFTAVENGVGSGQRYLDLGTAEPGYFLLKFGIGNGDKFGYTADTFFFQNTGEMTKLVWSDAQVELITGGSKHGNIGRLSHYTTYDASFAQISEVPEPATLALIGLGLLAIGTIRWQRQ